MAENVMIDRTIVEEMIQQGFQDPNLDEDDEKVLDLVSQFVSGGRSIASPQSSDLARRTGVSSQAQPLIDFTLSFSAQNAREIVEREEQAAAPSRSAEGAPPPAALKQGVAYFVQRECYQAFCKNDPKYGEEVKQISTNAKLIVGAIAGVVAATVGILVSVVSAITAAVIWMIAKIGSGAFCQYYSQFFEEKGGSPTPA